MMKYFGILLTIPVVVFGSFEDRDLSGKEQTAYRIEEKEMFAKDESFQEQIAKMFVSYELDEDDSFSLFEEESDESFSSSGVDEVSHLDENTRNDLNELYEDEDSIEFSPSQETVPQRSKVVQSRPKVARQSQTAATHRKQALKQKSPEVITAQPQKVQKQKRVAQVETFDEEVQSQPQRKAQAQSQQPKRVQKKQQQQAAVMEEPQVIQQPQRKAPAVKTPVKKKAAPARSPVVQNGKKTAQAPASSVRKKAAAPKSGQVAQKRAATVKKGQQVQRRNPDAAVRRPTVEVEEFEE